MSQPLLIFGASARSAAFSAQKAGYAPIAADMFGDTDLRARCRATRVASYPRGLVTFARQWLSTPWMYTGALENEPSLVDEITRDRPLWGNPGSVLRNVRDPSQVAAALDEAGLCAPQLAAGLDDLTGDATWLSKPHASCGGGRIHVVDTRTAPGEHADVQGRYLQQYIEGVPCGAVYVAAQGNARLLGVTRQLLGMGEGQGRSSLREGTPLRGVKGDYFQYAGSLGPLDVNESCAEQFRRIGDCLATRFDLTGLFGVDAIIANDAVWPVEVNPRYTASIEILERALSFVSIRLHAAACLEGRLPDFSFMPDAMPARYGKAVLYADADVVVRDDFTRQVLRQNDGPWPRYADIPAPGTKIESGQPVLTVFAEATSEEGVEQKLRDRIATVREWLSRDMASL
jgi:predicted ATP-grasp superfamily ATP-dependent carboligase